MSNQLGRLLLVLGGLMMLAGLVVLFAGRLGIGRLPGDVVYRRGNFTFYFPVVSSILLSLVLTAVLWILRRR